MIFIEYVCVYLISVWLTSEKEILNHNTINFIHSYKSRDHVGNHDITQGVFHYRNIKYNRNRNTEKRVLFQKIFYPHLHYSTHLKTQSRYSIFFDNILFFILTHAQPKGPFISEKGSLHLLFVTITYFCGETIVFNSK